MFTLFLENSKEYNEVCSYISKNFNLQDVKFKEGKNKIVFTFDASSIQNFSLFISNLIITIYERILIKKIIKKNYFYFSDYEQLQISNISSSIIDDNSQSKDDLVFISVYDYIKNNPSMILSGFINFRLKDYIEVLEYLVDLSVNNFIINREYDKFITLLRDYINSEPSKIDVINLVYLNQEAILLDKNKNIIPIDNNIVDSKYLSDISFSNNDYVLNTVLNLLPNKLYVHVLSQEDEFLKTLKNIFSNKISICYDCEICNFYKTTFADSKNKSND